MRIKVLVFAYLKELIGKDNIDLDLADDTTGDDILQKLEELFPQIKSQRKFLKLSMNGEYIRGEDAILNGSEIGVFPPVSGG